MTEWISGEECRAILNALGYFQYTPGDDSTYVSTGKFSGPKGFGVEMQLTGDVDIDAFFAWLRDLGIDPTALDRIADGLDPLY